MSRLLSDEIKFFIDNKAYQHETIVDLVNNRFKKTISNGTTSNKYDEHGGVNNNWTEECLSSLMFNKPESL